MGTLSGGRPAALLLAFCAVSLLTGCIQTQATMLDPSARQAIPEDQVRVYRTPESVRCEYDEVAIVHAQGGANHTTEGQMIAAARKRAARVGANGVILGRINEPSAGAKIAGAIFGVSPDRRGEMVAIFVHDPCHPVAENPAPAEGE